METPGKNQKGIRLRSSLEPGDIGYITYLHGILYAREYQWGHTFEGYVADSLAKFALSYDARKDRLWIAEMGSQIVGCIGIVGRSDLEAQLRWFLVHPTYRGQGLGHNLLNEAIRFCREHRFKSVFLWTVSVLEAATHLYQSAGFRKTEEKTHLIWGHTITEERYDMSLTPQDLLRRVRQDREAATSL